MLESSFFPVRSDPGLARLAGQAGGGVPEPQPVFRLETDPEGRIDGSVPVWTDNPSAADRVAGDLTNAEQITRGGARTVTPGNAYADPGADSAPPHPFGFGDLFDMVNPLQHIPLVSNVYRYITGDTIQPVAQVVGDAVYGGALAAAGSLINVIVKDATGKDVAGNLMALAFNESRPDASKTPSPDNEIAIADAGNTTLSNLPGTVIGFADLSGGAGAPNPAARASSAPESLASIMPSADGTPAALPASLPQPPRGALSGDSISAFDVY